MCETSHIGDVGRNRSPKLAHLRPMGAACLRQLACRSLTLRDNAQLSHISNSSSDRSRIRNYGSCATHYMKYAFLFTADALHFSIMNKFYFNF